MQEYNEHSRKQNSFDEEKQKPRKQIRDWQQEVHTDDSSEVDYKQNEYRDAVAPHHLQEACFFLMSE